jgi:hypothetical protein
MLSPILPLRVGLEGPAEFVDFKPSGQTPVRIPFGGEVMRRVIVDFIENVISA